MTTTGWKPQTKIKLKNLNTNNGRMTDDTHLCRHEKSNIALILAATHPNISWCLIAICTSAIEVIIQLFLRFAYLYKVSVITFQEIYFFYCSQLHQDICKWNDHSLFILPFSLLYTVLNVLHSLSATFSLLLWNAADSFLK